MKRDLKRQTKRRNCADRMRRNFEKQRRNNLATKTIWQLLSVVSVILAKVQPVQEGIVASGSDLWRPPSWYPNGPAAWARERGLEPEDNQEIGSRGSTNAHRPTVSASWLRLVKDLNRRATRERAREIIETRVPPEAVNWLQEMIELEDWTALRVVGHGRTKEEIYDFALMEAMKWQVARVPAVPPAPATPDEPDDTTPPVRPGPK